MRAHVVHVNDRVPDAVYIGRRTNRRGLARSPFANPYPVAMGRQTAIAKYRDDLLGDGDLLAQLPMLRGRPLACWCRHADDLPTEETACHGDVLVELLDRYSDDELRSWQVP